MEKFTILRGVAAPMMQANINTDAISPVAAGLSAKTDLGAMLFANWRYDLAGKEIPDFILNRPPFRESKILVAGANFGCGSSRERAVWALMRFGIGCVVAPSFGEIFHDNAFQNGLLPVVLPARDCAILGAALAEAQDPHITVDLVRCVVEGPDGRALPFTVAPERRTALMEGLDEFSEILRMEPAIDVFQQADQGQRPWIYHYR
jgi:3-isopropylmalate/(R)-2-methylmalate dehydratase small subunit